MNDAQQLKAAKHADKHVLNISEEHIDKMITMTEQSIIVIKKRLVEVEEPYKKAEEDLELARAIYTEAQSKVNAVQVELGKEENMLEALVAFKRNDKNLKRIKVYRTISNTKQKVRETGGKRFKWMEASVVLFENVQKFLSPVELFESIVETNPEAKKAYENSAHPASYKNHTISNILNGIRDKGSVRKQESTAMLVEYTNKIGLVRWIGEDNLPMARYLNSIAFQGETTTE